ncbi:Gfo/Idh/MocA family oxidoreductase [Candidatus Poribacteria bacterium]|jgi:virulence factor|nr:Gfo/Idh/MocA family oxidoreductase [Candidatus Poribacteria bacterium]MBT5711583.1 Gfo/Idh/MocA family oxidoreductase [Candidatus Poribacteria bacterium]MBT7807311.1 Gfo/Idh/MocA family oxidoreductase [Candidatus Poribacteria bacterium]
MESVRVAFIGAGSLANSVHYPSLAEMADVEIVGIAELNEPRMRSTAEKFGVERTFGDYREMLESVDADAVYVLMPPHHLFDIAVTVLKSGRHLFIEKPPGVTSYQTAALAELAEKQGLKAMCAFNRRHIPLLLWAREQVEAQGPINQCVSTFYKHHTGGHYYDGAIDILTCDAVHAVDTLRWLGGGEVTRVTSSVKAVGASFKNAFNAIVEFDSGATGVLLTNWMTGARVHTWELHAAGGSAFVDGDLEARVTTPAGVETRSTQDVAGSDSTHRYYGFYGESRHFIDCIKEDRTPTSHLGDAVKTMQLVEAIYASSIA